MATIESHDHIHVNRSIKHMNDICVNYVDVPGLCLPLSRSMILL